MAKMEVTVHPAEVHMYNIKGAFLYLGEPSSGVERTISIVLDSSHISLLFFLKILKWSFFEIIYHLRSLE